MRDRTRAWIAGVAAVLLLAVPAGADEWNEKTILKFSAPVMVPGATLPPGEYVFQIANGSQNRNLIQIFSTTDERKLITTTEAVPIRRAEVNDDVVLRVQPTEAGAPAAITAWFYPGSRYGHQFIYPEAQARDLARRSKSLVLSRDVSTSDAQAGTIHLIDAQGQASAFTPDASTVNEWNAWRRAHPNADGVAQTSVTPGGSSVSLVRTDRRGMVVKIDDLEDHPKQYIGQQVSVDAEVEEVLGPRLFTIDEPNWGDLEGEILVVLPTPLAALVKDDERITVEGTVRQFTTAAVKNEWGWMDVSPEAEKKLEMRPVIVADRIVGGSDQRALIVRAGDASSDRPTGTSGSASASASVTSPDVVARGTDDLVGRRIQLTNVPVERTTAEGFLIRSGDTRILVVPALAPTRPIAAGTALTLDGVILQMPRQMVERLGSADVNDQVYVYALGVRQ